MSPNFVHTSSYSCDKFWVTDDLINCLFLEIEFFISYLTYNFYSVAKNINKTKHQNYYKHFIMFSSFWLD